MNCRHPLMERLDREWSVELLEDAGGEFWAGHGPSRLPQNVERGPRPSALGMCALCETHLRRNSLRVYVAPKNQKAVVNAS